MPKERRAFNQTVWEARDGLRGAMQNVSAKTSVIMDSIREHLPEHGNFVETNHFRLQLGQFPILQPRTSMNPHPRHWTRVPL